MDFKFFCPFCAQHIQVDAESCGSSCDCPSCNKVISIPNPDFATPPVLVAKKMSWQRFVALLLGGVFLIFVLLFLIGSLASKRQGNVSGPVSDNSSSAGNTASQINQSEPPTVRAEKIFTQGFQKIFTEHKQEIFDGFHPIGQAQSITVHEVSIVWKDNLPQNDFDNILEATVRFTIYWTSPLHNDGFTKVEATFDCESKRFTSSKVLATNGTTTEQAGNILGAAIGTAMQYEAQKQGTQDAVNNYLNNQ